MVDSNFDVEYIKGDSFVYDIVIYTFDALHQIWIKSLDVEVVTFFYCKINAISYQILGFELVNFHISCKI